MYGMLNGMDYQVFSSLLTAQSVLQHLSYSSTHTHSNMMADAAMHGANCSSEDLGSVSLLKDTWTCSWAGGIPSFSALT